MTHCTCCNSLFDEPDVVRRRENLDGERGYIIVAEKFCPVCGAEHRRGVNAAVNIKARGLIQHQQTAEAVS